MKLSNSISGSRPTCNQVFQWFSAANTSYDSTVESRCRRRRLAAFSTAILSVAALALPAAGTTRSATTGPELIYPIRVTLNDRGIVLSASPRMQLDTTILFIVRNRASNRRWFAVGNRPATLRRTHLLRPGRSEQFYYIFRARGTVKFQSGGPGVTLRTGKFTVV